MRLVSANLCQELFEKYSHGVTGTDNFIIFNDENKSVGALAIDTNCGNAEIKMLCIDNEDENRGIFISVLNYLKSRYSSVKIKCSYKSPLSTLCIEEGFKEVERVYKYTK